MIYTYSSNILIAVRHATGPLHESALASESAPCCPLVLCWMKRFNFSPKSHRLPPLCLMIGLGSPTLMTIDSTAQSWLSPFSPGSGAATPVFRAAGCCFVQRCALGRSRAQRHTTRRSEHQQIATATEKLAWGKRSTECKRNGQGATPVNAGEPAQAAAPPVRGAHDGPVPGRAAGAAHPPRVCHRRAGASLLVGTPTCARRLIWMLREDP